MINKLLALALAMVCGACERPPLSALSGFAGQSGAGAGGAGGAAGTGGSAGGGPADAAPVETYVTGAISVTRSRKLDLLFVIDDGPSTGTPVEKLSLQLPIFMQALQALPAGLPDIHLAIVTADMGGCGTGTGDGGVFRSQPNGTCADTTLAAGATFVADDATGVTKNFTLVDPMGISAVLQCLLPVDESGCELAQPLASAARALGADGRPPPAQNAGFLRDDADLAIVVLTAQDDCSIPPGSGLFSGSSTKVSDPLGPRSPYRCNEFGHLCGGLAPPRASPNPGDLTTTATLDDCVSNEDGLLTPIASFVAGLEALKSDPGMILVAAIAAPTTPYTVTWQAPPIGADTQPWPEIEHACTSADGDGSFGDPSVRTAQWIAAFGDNGHLTSVCDNSYAVAVGTIASKVSVLAGPNCVPEVIQRDVNDAPECTVTSHAAHDGGVTDRGIPACDPNGGGAGCWTLQPDAQACPDGALSFNINTDSTDPNMTGLTYSYRCTVSNPTR